MRAELVLAHPKVAQPLHATNVTRHRRFERSEPEQNVTCGQADHDDYEWRGEVVGSTCWYCGPSTHEKASLGGVPPLLWASPYSCATCRTTSKNLMTSPPPLSVS